MNIIKKNTKKITIEEAYFLTNNSYPICFDDLISFRKQFYKSKQIIIARQAGLGDLLIERINKIYFVSDIII